MESLYTGNNDQYLVHGCILWGGKMCDMLYSNYCSWSHSAWNRPACPILCEMPCHFQSVPFNKLALYRKSVLIIPYMILICINRKYPFVCHLKVVFFFFPVHCYNIVKYHNPALHHLSGLLLPFCCLNVSLHYEERKSQINLCS